MGASSGRSLIEIFVDAVERSPQLLERRRAAFDKTLGLVADNPGIGARRLPRAPDVRTFPYDRYLVFHRPLAAGDGIDLLRIHPASSDWLGSLDIATPCGQRRSTASACRASPDIASTTI
jgi:plasmid stabilization system protein ParE